MNQEEKANYSKILTFFVSICSENNLWYSLANNTLLSAKTNIDYYENIGILEIFVTEETYSVLRNKYKENVIDFTCSDSFYLLTPFFYMKENNKFIKIIIIVPTNVKKIEKFLSVKNKIRYNYSNFLTFKNGYNFFSKIVFGVFRIFPLFFLPLDYKETYDLLYDHDYRGFFAMNSANELSIKNWFPNLTFKTKNISFLNNEVKIIKECDEFLLARYGQNWDIAIEIKWSHFDYNKIQI